MLVNFYNLSVLITNNKIKNIKLIIIYNKKRFIIFNTLYTKYLKNSNSLYINNPITGFPGLKLITLFQFFCSWASIFTKKIKFKGKGYKIIKRLNTLKLNFNHSHVLYFIIFNLLNKRLAKQKHLFAYKNKNKLEINLNTITKVRLINIFTKRGLRCTSQKIFKKIGKRSI